MKEAFQFHSSLQVEQMHTTSVSADSRHRICCLHTSSYEKRIKDDDIQSPLGCAAILLLLDVVEEN